MSRIRGAFGYTLAVPYAIRDARPDELDIAIAVDRMQQALDIEVRRVEHSWAGLRSFTQDRSLAIGWDGAVAGFFWSVGQGGYGIQTSPAQGQLVADASTPRTPLPPAAGSEIDDKERVKEQLLPNCVTV